MNIYDRNEATYPEWTREDGCHIIGLYPCKEHRIPKGNYFDWISYDGFTMLIGLDEHLEYKHSINTIPGVIIDLDVEGNISMIELLYPEDFELGEYSDWESVKFKLKPVLKQLNQLASLHMQMQYIFTGELSMPVWLPEGGIK